MLTISVLSINNNFVKGTKAAVGSLGALWKLCLAPGEVFDGCSLGSGSRPARRTPLAIVGSSFATPTNSLSPGGSGSRPKPTFTPTPRAVTLLALHQFKPARPPFTYAELVAQAIAAAPNFEISLHEIYTWVTDHYPYFPNDGKGWQASPSLPPS